MISASIAHIYDEVVGEQLFGFGGGRGPSSRTRAVGFPTCSPPRWNGSFKWPLPAMLRRRAIQRLTAITLGGVAGAAMEWRLGAGFFVSTRPQVRHVFCARACVVRLEKNGTFNSQRAANLDVRKGRRRQPPSRGLGKSPASCDRHASTFDEVFASVGNHGRDRGGSLQRFSRRQLRKARATRLRAMAMQRRPRLSLLTMPADHFVSRQSVSFTIDRVYTH